MGENKKDTRNVKVLTYTKMPGKYVFHKPDGANFGLRLDQVRDMSALCIEIMSEDEE